MAHSYPIWVEATNCNYKAGKVSYGYKNTGQTKYFVGSSKSNSHLLVETVVMKKKRIVFGKEYYLFEFYADGIRVSNKWFECNNDRAGQLVENQEELNNEYYES